MVLQTGGIFAQAEMVGDNTFVSCAVDEVTGANLFAGEVWSFTPCWLISMPVTLVFWRGTAP